MSVLSTTSAGLYSVKLSKQNLEEIGFHILQPKQRSEVPGIGKIYHHDLSSMYPKVGIHLTSTQYVSKKYCSLVITHYHSNVSDLTDYVGIQESWKVVINGLSFAFIDDIECDLETYFKICMSYNSEMSEFFGKDTKLSDFTCSEKEVRSIGELFDFIKENKSLIDKMNRFKDFLNEKAKQL